jgi:hypothetical protein
MQAADQRETRDIPEMRNRDGTESGKKSQAVASIWGRTSASVVSTNFSADTSDMEISQGANVPVEH